MKTSDELRKYKQAMKGKKATNAERRFKHRLKAAKIRHICQCIVGFYIVDFVLPDRMLVIEIDGSSHIGREQYDARRDEYIRSLGFRVERIANEDVDRYDLAGVARYRRDRRERRFSKAVSGAHRERQRAEMRQRERERANMLLQELDAQMFSAMERDA